MVAVVDVAEAAGGEGMLAQGGQGGVKRAAHRLATSSPRWRLGGGVTRRRRSGDPRRAGDSLHESADEPPGLGPAGPSPRESESRPPPGAAAAVAVRRRAAPERNLNVARRERRDPAGQRRPGGASGHGSVTACPARARCVSSRARDGSPRRHD